MLTLKEKTKKTHLAEIVQNIPISNNIYLMDLECDLNTENISPGNFISILCEGKILRRPFSIAGAFENKIRIIYKVKGEGTKYLSKLTKWQKVDFIGPLGNSFSLNKEKSLLIGAGVGLAPMLFLNKKLSQQGTASKLLAGLQTRLNIQLPLNCNLYTDDGSSGLAGSVIDNLEQEIISYQPEIIYTCGPTVVMRKAVELADKYNIRIETAMERDFACGVGACMGCVVKTREDDCIVNKRICKDGPVFDGRSIIWQ